MPQDRCNVEHVHLVVVGSNLSTGQNSPARASKHELGGLCPSCQRPFLQQQQGRKRSRVSVWQGRRHPRNAQLHRGGVVFVLQRADRLSLESFAGKLMSDAREIINNPIRIASSGTSPPANGRVPRDPAAPLSRGYSDL